MSYVTISTWKSNIEIENQDAMWQAIQEKYIPATKALGATHAMWVETGDGELSLISTYPDKVTCDAADAKRAELRSQGASEFDATMTGESRGDVKASTD